MSLAHEKRLCSGGGKKKKERIRSKSKTVLIFVFFRDTKVQYNTVEYNNIGYTTVPCAGLVFSRVSHAFATACSEYIWM